MFNQVEFHTVLLVSKPSLANMWSKSASTVFISESQHQLGSCFNHMGKYQTWARGTVSYDCSYKHRHAWQEEALHVGNTRAANLPLCALFLSPFCLFLYLCNILSSPSSLPCWSLKMFPGVSFNEVDLDGWKLPSQGHFIVMLRWTLLSMKGGNIRSLGSHKRTKALSFFVFCCIQIQLEGLRWHTTIPDTVETQYAPGPLSHADCTKSKLKNVMLLACSHISDEPAWTGWEKNWLNLIAGWWFLIVLAKIWSNLSKTLPAAMWRDVHAEALACRMRTETKEAYQEASS